MKKYFQIQDYSLVIQIIMQTVIVHIFSFEHSITLFDWKNRIQNIHHKHMSNDCHQYHLTKVIPLLKPISKSLYDKQNTNPLQTSSKIKIGMSMKLPKNFFNTPDALNLPKSKTMGRRVFSLPKLDHKPVVRSDGRERMMSSNMFMNKPSFRLLEKMKFNNYITAQKKTKLIL